jgi:hypothetical protein
MDFLFHPHTADSRYVVRFHQQGHGASIEEERGLHKTVRRNCSTSNVITTTKRARHANNNHLIRLLHVICIN